MCGISIVVLSHNNNSLKAVLEQILSLVSAKDEVIIVDDHSSADVLAMLQSYEEHTSIVSVLYSTKCGNRSHNRNIGANHAKNEWLLFVDGDIILADQALNVLRDAIHFTPYIGFCGPLHGTRYSAEAMLLYSGIENYQALLTTPQGRQQILDDSRLMDKRTDDFLNEKYRRFRWALFFSGCCAVKRSAFRLAGGFDEEFIGWGAEDVDFGYRLSLHGNIQFLPEFHGIHVPHPRDIFRVNSQNHTNMYYMLSKYQSWEFEVLIVAKGAMIAFASFLELITQMRQISLLPIDYSEIPSCITVNVFSRQTPHGNIVCHFEDGETTQFNLFGMALPLPDKKVRIAFVSQNIWIYPEAVSCEILREVLRVAEEVFLCGPLPDIRICHKDINRLSGPVFQFAFSIQDIMEFRFERVQEDFVRVTSATCDLLSPLPAIPLELDRSRLANLSKCQKPDTKRYVVVDCCGNGGSRILLADFIRKSGLSIDHVIHIRQNISHATQFAPDDELMCALRSYTQPLLFLISSPEENPAIIDFWHLRNCPTDIVCGMNGYVESACLN